MNARVQLGWVDPADLVSEEDAEEAIDGETEEGQEA
jgi:N utilization substance protein A